jgi:hypothetical protein
VTPALVPSSARFIRPFPTKTLQRLFEYDFAGIGNIDTFLANAGF